MGVGDTGVTEVESAMQSIYSGDPGVARQHLIFISSCHTTKIHSIFPNFWSHSVTARLHVTCQGPGNGHFI